jgi:mannose-1-phosphate guanylyltransferase/mannose-6-phosphate isomerase
MTGNAEIRPVIMSGGAGTRLWPMSREARPKQFLALASDRALFEEALERVRPGADAPFLSPLIIGSWRHAAVMKDQAMRAGVSPAAILCEPCPRNTAAVAAVAAGWAANAGEDGLILLMPADHHIADSAAFRRAVMAAAPQAAAGRIVTFGVKPAGPHIGYGYIEAGEALDGAVFAVKAFREKPDFETAQKYVASGRHFWNAGIFLFSAQAMREELGRLAPEILDRATAALKCADQERGVIKLNTKEFEACPADSIDYAVMEKTDKAAVIAPVEVGWSDVGDWPAVMRTGDEANIARIESDGALVVTDGPFVGVIGVDDLLVVAAGGAGLVMPKSRAQDVKKIVEALKERGLSELL